MNLKSYRELTVWQKSMNMVRNIYSATYTFPKEEMYGLTSQIRRTAVSVPSNIAEGYGRNTTKDFINFLYFARGSLFELQTQLEISVDLNFLSVEKGNSLIEETTEIAKMLHSMLNKLENKLTKC